MNTARAFPDTGQNEDALAASVKNYITPEQIEALEGSMLEYEQAPTPVVHHFSPGVYARQVTIPRWTFAVGHAHKHDCLNVVLAGRVSTLIGGEVKMITAPCVFVGKAMDRKVGFVHEEAVWLTVHATNETDIAKLEEELLVKSPTFLAFEKRLHEGGVARKILPEYSRMLRDVGATENEVRAATENTQDQIPFPLVSEGRVFVETSTINEWGLFAGIGFSPGDVIVPARIGLCRTPAGRYTNHTDRPNANMRLDENLTINLVAAREIRVGDEITVDYRQARSVALEADAAFTANA